MGSNPGFCTPSIVSEHAEALYNYWLTQRGKTVVPARTVIDPTAISDLLPWIHLLDHKADGSFGWRLMGTELAAFFGRDRTGQAFDPAALPRHDGLFLIVYTAIGDQPCGAVVRCLARMTSGRVVTMETLALPLLDDVGRATRIIAYSEVLGLGRRELQRFGCFVDLTIQRLDFFDIGAGKPPGGVSWRSSIPSGRATSPK